MCKKRSRRCIFREIFVSYWAAFMLMFLLVETCKWDVIEDCRIIRTFSCSAELVEFELFGHDSYEKPSTFWPFSPNLNFLVLQRFHCHISIGPANNIVPSVPLGSTSAQNE